MLKWIIAEPRVWPALYIVILMSGVMSVTSW